MLKQSFPTVCDQATAKAITDCMSEVESWAKDKGWWHPENRNPLELLMLITTELAECAEAYRNHNPKCDKIGLEDFSEAEEEMADVLVRVFHMAGEMGLRLGDAYVAKMRYNHNRPNRHGGKKY